MKKNIIIIFQILVILFFTLFYSCKTFEKNNDNLTNLNFVYLIQNPEFSPIFYPVSDYLIKPYSIEFEEIEFNNNQQANFDFNKTPPSFLQNKELSFFQSLDPENDKTIYIEVFKYFSSLLTDENFLKILGYLDKYINEQPPQPYRIELGDYITMYQNGLEYRYPLEKGATIIEFIDKSYQIKFEDGRIFNLLSDGTYFETLKDGSEIYYVNPNKKIFRRWFGTLLLTKYENSVTAQIGNSTLYLILKEDKQNLIYTLSNKYKFSILLKANYLNNSDSAMFQYFFQTPIFNFSDIVKLSYDTLKGFSIILDNTLKIAYFKLEDKLISIQKNLTKIIYNIKCDNSFKVLSIYLPEGIKLTDFDKDYSSSEVNFGNRFKIKSIGDFRFYYNQEIEKLVENIDDKKLKIIQQIIVNNLNWHKTSPINIVLPENIYQFQQLLAANKKEIFSWLPDGFVRDDLIITWPLQTPRYYEDKSMNYFFEKEFYTTLAFLLTKKIMKQQVNFFGRIPFFIETGLPLYISTLVDEKLHQSMQSIFQDYIKNNFPIQGAQLVLTNPYRTPMPQTKILSALSYYFVRYILSIYKEDRITLFIRSFKTSIDNLSFNMLSSSEQYMAFTEKRIKEIFGVTMDKLIEAFLLLK